jgi:hypothetical protein
MAIKQEDVTREMLATSSPDTGCRSPVEKALDAAIDLIDGYRSLVSDGQLEDMYERETAFGEALDAIPDARPVDAQLPGRDDILRGLAAFFAKSVHHVWSNDEIADCLTNMISEPAALGNAGAAETTFNRAADVAEKVHGLADRIKSALPSPAPEPAPDAVRALQSIHDAVNTLGGRPDQDNSYDQGIVDTVAKTLEIIEKAQAALPPDARSRK